MNTIPLLNSLHPWDINLSVIKFQEFRGWLDWEARIAFLVLSLTHSVSQNISSLWLSI